MKSPFDPNKHVYQRLTPPLEGAVRIISSGEDPSRGKWVATDLWYAHPRGGGQQEDRGTIGTVPILNVTHDEEWGIKHYVADLEGLKIGTEALVDIDGEWRRLQARSHTAGHAIAAAVSKLMPSLRPIAGHHWLGQGRVEFEGTLADVTKVGALVLESIQALAARQQPVAMDVDSNGMRSISIAGDTVPCGGTHLVDCGLLASMVLRSVKAKDGRTRISYGFPDEPDRTKRSDKPLA